MRKALMMAVLVTAIAAAFPRVSMASPGVGASLGEGLLKIDGDVHRTDVNLEALVFYGLGIAQFDLGLLFNMENTSNDIVVRPGARLSIPGILYGRVAFPFQLAGDSDWGIMLGVGRNLLSLGVVKVFAEMDATFMDSVSFSDAVPIEFRIGVSLGF